MKISAQAKQAAYDIRTQDNDEGFSTMENTIQIAINDHERDLVEAAEKVLNPTVGIEFCDGYEALKAALDRRKE